MPEWPWFWMLVLLIVLALVVYRILTPGAKKPRATDWNQDGKFGPW